MLLWKKFLLSSLNLEPSICLLLCFWIVYAGQKKKRKNKGWANKSCPQTYSKYFGLYYFNKGSQKLWSVRFCLNDVKRKQSLNYFNQSFRTSPMSFTVSVLWCHSVSCRIKTLCLGWNMTTPVWRTALSALTLHDFFSRNFSLKSSDSNLKINSMLYIFEKYIS